MTIKEAFREIQFNSPHFNYSEVENAQDDGSVMMDVIITRSDDTVFIRSTKIVRSEEDRETLRLMCLLSIANAAMLAPETVE